MLVKGATEDTSKVSLNTLRPTQGGHNFPDNIFKCNFLNESVWILINISLNFVPEGQINNITALVQIMAWGQPGDKPLSEPVMVRLLIYIYASLCLNVLSVCRIPMLRYIFATSVDESSDMHYIDVIMSAMVSQITSVMIVYSTVYSGTNQRKHQSSASLAFVQGIQRWPVNSLHKGSITWKIFPFDDIIM